MPALDAADDAGMGGGMSHGRTSDDAQEKRVADLEREVAELRAARNEQQYLSTRR